MNEDWWDGFFWGLVCAVCGALGGLFVGGGGVLW